MFYFEFLKKIYVLFTECFLPDVWCIFLPTANCLLLHSLLKLFTGFIIAALIA